MQKISVGLFALAASLTLGVATLHAQEYGKGKAGGGAESQQGGGGGSASGGAKMHDEGGGGGGGGGGSGGSGGSARMRHDGGGDRIRPDRDQGGSVRMRNHDGGGRIGHHRRGHWRGGIWIYDDYDGGYGGGYCYRARRICADRWGWGGPGFRRCLRHRGC
ncbi:cellulase [Hyphomicrobium denitrificans 1NES1]|uniref:Cellulase n=1 Tax=Hyphomicrobium denitrificans 1NES1 TaxID=670307 RepID=N0BGN7_9HYPH|nr:hypothetical protein [Hyphomicrobium denitrificans]AGK59310.1 cellulase [Hyphomicrobium denitrificans 1NES1]